MKIRRVYKRDKDGQFARVNSLLGAASDAAKKRKLKSKAQSPNRVPSKSDRRSNRNAPDPQLLDAAAGKLSLAEGPAREIAKKHDLSGHNRSEANKAAYRECAKYARELRAKYGADAPTADRIYSAAKLIQKGGDLSAKIRQEEGDGNGAPNPLPPKPPKKPSPDPNSGNGSDKKIKPVTSGNLWKLGTSDLIDQHKLAIQGNRPRIADRIITLLRDRSSKGDKEAFDFFNKPSGSPNKPTVKPKKDYGTSVTNPTDKQIQRELMLKNSLDNWWSYSKQDFESFNGGEFRSVDALDYFFEHILSSYEAEDFGYTGDDRHTLIDQDRKLLMDLADPDAMYARMKAGFERWLRTSPSSEAIVKENPNFYTDDLFEWYIDSGDMSLFDRNSPINMQEIADKLRKDIRESGFDGIGIVKKRKPRRDIRDLYLKIERARRLLRSALDEQDRLDQQKRINGFNEDLKQQIEDSTLEELKVDANKLNRDWIRADHERKIYLNRAEQADDGDGGYLQQAEKQKILAQNINSVLRKVQNRIDELEGKDTNVRSAGLLEWSDNATQPTVQRRNRESSISDAFSEWAADKDTSTASKALGKFKTDEVVRQELLDGFFNDLKNDQYLAEKNGYGDLSPEERDKLAAQDRRDLEESLDPSVLKARIRNDFFDWLVKSSEANDLASLSYGKYSSADYFSNFLDTSSDYNQNLFGGKKIDKLVDLSSILKDLEKSFRDQDPGAEALASRPRPPQPVVGKDAEPVEYRAKDRSRASELRKESKYLTNLVLWKINNNPNFDTLTEDEKARVRKETNDVMTELSNVNDELAKATVNRSRNLSEAKDFHDLVDIMIDRNPSIKSMNGWNEADGDLEKAMEEGGVHGVHREIVLARAVKCMEAAERMADAHPDVPWDGFNAYGKRAFKNPKAIAHCSRGYSIAVEMNVNFLAKATPAPGRNKDKFHPPNFENDPFYNVIIHEFGHSIDWYAFGYHELSRSDLIKERRDAGDNRDANTIWNEAWTKITTDRDSRMGSIIAEAYNDAVKSGKHTPTTGISAERDFTYWKDKHTSGYAKYNSHELIAESWQDYHSNGPENCSPVSKAVAEWVIKNYIKQVRKQKGLANVSQ